jgi:predicted nucleic acid-binding protein
MISWPRGALIDYSAWARVDDPRLPAGRSELLARAMEERRLVASLPLLLEAGYSARNGRDYDEIRRRLDLMQWAHVDKEVERRAGEAQRRLAEIGHHRLPPVDLLLAALADRHRLAILHYDHDYDLIADKTDLRFASVWLAEPGSL